MPNSVRYFDSEMSGAPELSGTAGALIGVLDGCLVDGFGSVTVDNLVVASDVATATVSAGHQFAMIGNAGPVIRIAGASPSGLNGDWRVSVTSATTFTFPTSGIADQTATGTITAKRAPAGFSRVYEDDGAYKAVYQSSDVASTQCLLRVDDSPAQYPTLIMYETMSNIDTGTGPGPTTGVYYAEKSSVASSTARPWRLFADDRAFYLFMLNDGNTNNWNAGLFFGDIVSYKSGDAYHCALIANTAQNSTFYLYIVANSAASLLARSYTQTGGAVAFARYSFGGSDLGSSGMAYPNPVDNAFHAWPVEVIETSVARGLMPGLWNPRHDDLNLPDQTIITDVPQLAAGGTLVVQRTKGTNRVALDLMGPWR